MEYAKPPKENWEESFKEQIAKQAYNTSPVESLVRTAAYHLRDRHPDGDYSKLHFLEMGCGAGPNLKWLAEKGVKVSGVDIAPTVLALCKKSLLAAGLESRIGGLLEASVTDVPLPDASVDGIFESCVFQHLNFQDRKKAFAEVKRLLKPGGAFFGNMMDSRHEVFQRRKSEALPDDPGTLLLEEGGARFYLTNQGLTHFYSREEFDELLAGFSVIDPSQTIYYLPKFEAAKRGYKEPYLQSMWTVYAVK
jgi:ubiquinone/menaquinone biosynthesis C-methylase UbiE